MLSRVAERMYWFGRYMERAENMARLINVNASLLLDLPLMVKHTWGDLINITGAHDLYYEKYEKADERNVVRYLLANESNPGSILSAVKMLRENVRTTREIMPSEVWEQINEFYLFVKQNVANATSRDGRHEFLDDVMHHCQQITGLLLGNMSHGVAYNFIRIGRNLERADMTTRIVDVGCLNLLKQREDIPETYTNILWMNVLRSLSAYQMYRQNVHDRVNGEDVVAFLVKDEEFPHAVAHCLTELLHCMEKLPRNDHCLRNVTRMRRMLSELDIEKLMESGLHDLIDEMQVELAEIHNQVTDTWFTYSGNPAEAVTG